MRGRKGAVAAATAAVAAALASCGFDPSSLFPDPLPAPTIHQAAPQAQLDQPVQHVFIIVKENHSYDNYFAAYPNPTGDPPTTFGRGVGGRIIPLLEPDSDIWSPGDNTWTVAHDDVNNGLMNGFEQGAHQPESDLHLLDQARIGHAIFNPSGENSAYRSYGITEASGRRRLFYYWFLADQGVLCDRFFGSLMGESFPNWLYLLASTSGGCITNADFNGSFSVLLDRRTFQTATRDHLGVQDVPTALPVLLENAGLTWTFFHEIANQTIETIAEGTPLDSEFALQALKALDVVQALPDFDKRHVETPKLDDRFSRYLAKGWGGHVNWVFPDPDHAEHPSLGKIYDGQLWTWKILNAIGHSPLWANSVVFITWDDYGGFYDHVPPPVVDDMGFSLRVPCLVVSPFAKKGVVQHQVRSFDSIVRFCEKTFHLPAMTARDAAADNFMDAFDFTQAPRPYDDFFPSGGK